jgi:hypothetical protein
VVVSHGTIVSYVWSFGDSTPTATGVTISHVFSALGTFDVTVVVTDNSGLSTTSSAVAVTVLPATNHVSKLGLKVARLGQSATASVSVKIVDAAGRAVPGATVVGTWSGMTPDAPASPVTNSRGSVVFTASSSERRGTVVFTVTGVTLSGTSYDPAANIAKQEDVDVEVLVKSSLCPLV